MSLQSFSESPCLYVQVFPLGVEVFDPLWFLYGWEIGIYFPSVTCEYPVFSTIFWSSYIFCNVYFWYLCWKSCGSCINSRSSEKHISLSYKSHNVVYTPMCNKCNVHMYVVWSGSRVHGTEIRTISWEIGQCFVLRRWLLVGFSIASEEMLLLLGRRWTKKVVLVNYQ